MNPNHFRSFERLFFTFTMLLCGGAATAAQDAAVSFEPAAPSARRKVFDRGAESAETFFGARAAGPNEASSAPATPPDRAVSLPDPDAVRAEKSPARIKPAQSESRDGFHWRRALVQSGVFLGIQHAYRMTQLKTRRQFVGPFFRDWGVSVKNLRGWKDGDGAFINYVAHPLQGGVTGRIFVNNSDRARRAEFGSSRRYWEGRLKAMAWSAVWSAQFELGPLSEASLGNVGLNPKPGYSQMAYVDLIVTPAAGTGVVVAEDAVDKYVLKNWLERKAGSASWQIKLLRSLLTPTTGFSNLLRGKMPWKRDGR